MRDGLASHFDFAVLTPIRHLFSTMIVARKVRRMPQYRRAG